ncbi:hypothetical protein SAMN05216323_106612 [Williamwhitmania taraxaci]|uniref:Outer membrane protein beta-barrel domain-containing protein n=2 Tax=Williamwhitmania taraxaci TaxID=1640674 RepID=A0A1G6QV62_9BACT|nr:hypothetical protein SAMN05216323_106612 [Williamwhitmania taraxaci]
MEENGVALLSVCFYYFIVNVMKKYLSIFMTVCFVGLVGTVHGQNYKTGVGLRLGSPTGITVKHFFASKSAVEGMLSFGWGGLGLTGLYELHNDIAEVPGLTWYYGIGAHLATSTSKSNPWGDRDNSIYLGADGIIGLEYTFKEAPVTIGLDAMPIVNLVERPGVWLQGGISFRYNFR